MKTQVYWIFFLVLFAAAACKKSNEQQAVVSKNTNFNSNQKVVESNVSATVQFSGYTWNVKNSSGALWGPGPNYWSAANVWVDGNGWLHLKLSKNTVTGRWECAEVTSTQNFGYGTYQWQIDDGALNNLDRNVVLGLFNYNGVDGHHEMDIEFARWGVQSNQPLNYTVYPPGAGSTFHTTFNFTQSGNFTTHRWKRTSSSVVFKAIGGFYDNDTNMFATSTCASPYTVSTLAMPIYMNLWMFQGLAPVNNSNREIVIRNFKFTP